MQLKLAPKAWLPSAGLSLLLVQPASADVLHVGPDPDQYATINAAISVAANGDLILVDPGVYAPIFMNGKSVSIHGSGSGESIIEIATGGGVFGNGTGIAVWNSTANPVSVGGFSIRQVPDLASAFGPWVSAQDCTETVEFFDLVLEPTQAFYGGGELGFSGFLTARDCRQLHVSGVHVAGAGTAVEDPIVVSTPFGWIYGGSSGVVALNTPMWISDSSFEGSTVPNCSAPPVWGNLFVPGYGLYADNSPIVAANTSFIGGSGQPAGGDQCPPLDGSAGLCLINNASLEFYGGPGASIRGGGGVEQSTGGPGALLYGPSALFHPPGVFPEGGLNSQGQAAEPIEELNPEWVLVQDYGEQRPGIVPSRYVVPPGESLDLALSGKPGLTQVVLWSEVLEEWSGGVPLDGDVFVNPLTAGTLGPVLLDSDGQASVGITVPADPAFSAVSVVLQTVEIENPLFTPSPTVRIAAQH